MEPQIGLEAAEALVDACKHAGGHELDLSGLRLNALPESLGSLTELMELDLSGNQLTAVPEILSNLISLNHLDLDNNQLTTVPPWVENLTGLTELNLGGNQLSTVPEGLRNLAHLKRLDLDNNRLTTVPPWVGNLSALTTLYLSGNQLTDFPAALSNLTGLVELYLSDNGLATVPESLGNLSDLETLYLSGNQFAVFPDTLCNLTGLVELNLSDNRLTAAPENLGNLTGLVELNLSDNRLTAAPESLGNLTELTMLNLRDNQLVAVPAALGNLTELATLYLNSNRLAAVPENLGNLTGLVELNLSDNRLTAVPESLGNLTELTTLRLSSNQLAAVASSLGNLSQLRRLDLDNNLLATVPESLGNLTKLIELNLYENQLTTVPDSLGNLTQLIELRLDINKLVSVPEALGNLTQLQRLDLDTNQLTTIPESLGNLTQIGMLYLFDNQLTSIPGNFSKLTELNTLNLSGNQLTNVPESLGNLTNLTWLDLSGNQLTVIPESLGNLTDLTEFNLSGNQLTAIPESLGNLTRLTTLSLSGNQLTTVPESLGNLTELTSLGLSGGNQLTTPPPEIISAGAQAVVSFLAEMGHDPVHQWASKVVVVGEGRVGKTSLLRALRGESHNRNEASTHGLTVDSLHLSHPNPPGGKNVIMRLSTWDFGGQEIYHATHQFFLTDRSLFLLLWDAQIGWEGSKLHYWLDMIKARAPQAPVVLVATHLGPRPPDLPLAELKETYPGLIAASLASDSESREGIEELRECIRREAARLPLMGATWPRRWLQAADAIRADQARHVEPEQLHALMANHGVTEEAHRQALTAALHSLGDLLFYPDDEELCDLVVLRPQWLTAYISRVLDSETVLESGGLFNHGLGNEIWQDVDRAMRRHFIRMMEHFDLSYRTEGRMSSLVVELLPWDPPPYQEQWDGLLRNDTRELRLRYRMHTVPPGIPTWFIAREHRFSIGLRWRSGTLLKHPDGEHFGLVVVDRHAKAAEIRVRGPYPHDFFAVLKDGFEQTLQRYPGLDITRSVPCPHKDDDGKSCPHEFPHMQLVTRLARKPPP